MFTHLQVIVYLKSSNYDLKVKLARTGDADQIMLTSVLRDNPKLRFELQCGTVNEVMGKVFDKVQVSKVFDR